MLISFYAKHRALHKANVFQYFSINGMCLSMISLYKVEFVEKLLHKKYKEVYNKSKSV